MIRVTLTKLECRRCGHVWAPIKEIVRQCPSCLTELFDKDWEPGKRGAPRKRFHPKYGMEMHQSGVPVTEPQTPLLP